MAPQGAWGDGRGRVLRPTRPVPSSYVACASPIPSPRADAPLVRPSRVLPAAPRWRPAGRLLYPSLSLSSVQPPTELEALAPSSDPDEHALNPNLRPVVVARRPLEHVGIAREVGALDTETAPVQPREEAGQSGLRRHHVENRQSSDCVGPLRHPLRPTPILLLLIEEAGATRAVRRVVHSAGYQRPRPPPPPPPRPPPPPPPPPKPPPRPPPPGPPPPPPRRRPPPTGGCGRRRGVR